MKIEIKHQFSGNVLFAHEQENNSMKITLEAGVATRANLKGADLEGADLEGAHLGGADLSSAHLSYANLGGAYLGGADLNGAYLNGADLNDANLNYANLSYANLSYANLSYAYLEGAHLGGANLNGAYLNGAYLEGTYLRGANLEGATYGEGIKIGNNPLFILGLTWPVYIFKTHIKIGCKLYSKKEWLEFTDSDIAKMDPHASEFWKRWKKHILWMAMEEKEK